MKYPHGRIALAVLLAALAMGLQAQPSTALKYTDFAWRASLTTPPDASLVRVELPAPALGALQSRTLNDVRIFDAQGQALPFAVLPAPTATAQEVQGPRVQALPMTQQATAANSSMVARVEVRTAGKGTLQQLQVQWSPATTAATGMQAALFDLRQTQGLLSGLDVDITLPDNMPVPVYASISKTLQQWQSLPTTGPLYQFQGADAPRNTRLQLAQPTQVRDHFLLLQWQGDASVTIKALQTRTAETAKVPAAVEVALLQGEPSRSGKGLEWALPPGAQVQSVLWSLPQANQLRTFSLQGRRATAAGGASTAAWEPLGSVVVYHLAQNGETRRNPPHLLPAGDWRSLRLTDWPSGETPPAELLQTRLQLQPVTLAFLANGQAPYVLAVGRADVPAAALPATTLTTAAATHPHTWPLATVGGAVAAPHMQAKRFADRWRYFLEDSNAHTGFLWMVLGAAVLALGAVALKLLRSTHSGPDTTAPPPP